MILVELPFAFASMVFLVGVYMFLVSLFVHKKFDRDAIWMSLGGFIFGVIYIHIIKYTFIEGIFFRCPDIQFFCS